MSGTPVIQANFSVDAFLAIGRKAKAAARELALAPAEQKDRALRAAAGALRTRMADILQKNAADRKAAESAGRPASFVDRLTLTEARVEAWRAGSRRSPPSPIPLAA